MNSHHPDVFLEFEGELKRRSGMQRASTRQEQSFYRWLEHQTQRGPGHRVPTRLLGPGYPIPSHQEDELSDLSTHSTIQARPGPEHLDHPFDPGYPILPRQEDEFSNPSTHSTDQSEPDMRGCVHLPGRWNAMNEQLADLVRHWLWPIWGLPRLWILAALVAATLGLGVIIMPGRYVTWDDGRRVHLSREEFRILPNLNITGLLCQYANLEDHIDAHELGERRPVSKPDVKAIAEQLSRVSALEDSVYAVILNITQRRDKATQDLEQRRLITDSSTQRSVTWQLWRHAGPLWALSSTLAAIRVEAQRAQISISNDLAIALLSLDSIISQFCQPVSQEHVYQVHRRELTPPPERRAVELALGLCTIAEAGLDEWRACNKQQWTASAQSRCVSRFPRGSIPDIVEKLLRELDVSANDARTAASCGVVCACLIYVHWILDVLGG
ncbi:hypothetical protein F4861DRAFT_536438 [Xylaria intraflava]|nr:hypothetical protein F4861DRAFT_536438 [Xylaria intraflava]